MAEEKENNKSKGKVPNRFIETFVKIVFESAKTSGLVIAAIFEAWASTSYKGSGPRGKYYDNSDYNRGIRNLKHRGLIKINGNKLEITNNGKIWLKNSYLKYLKMTYPKWDKKWRVVIFDIPEELHTNRNRLRRKLKSLGFYILQKSIFVYPYPCEKEVAEICDNFRILDYVDVLVADSIGAKQDEIKKFYDL